MATLKGIYIKMQNKLNKIMHWIKTLKSDLVEFHRQNRLFFYAELVVSALICVVLTYFTRIVDRSLMTGVLVAFIAFAAGFVNLWMCSDNWKRLTTRVSATEPIAWTVSVNGVRMKELSDVTYASILRSVYFDPSTHFPAFMRAISHIAKAFFIFALAGPATIFWLVLLLWYSSPAELVSAIGTLKIAQASALADLAFNFTFFAAGSYSVAYLVGLHFTGSIFKTKIASKVLQAIDCPATGQVTLSLFNPNGSCYKFDFWSCRA